MTERRSVRFRRRRPAAEPHGEGAAEVERPEGGEDDPALMEPVIEALKTVRDPEIPVNLVESRADLRADRQEGRHRLCRDDPDHARPARSPPSMPGEVEAAVRAVPGVNDVRVKLVWTPPWTQDRMSEEAKLELGLL